MSNTATDWLIFGSGLSGVSTHRFFDFGCVLMNSEPPPWPFSVCTTFHAYCRASCHRVGADQRRRSRRPGGPSPTPGRIRMHEVGAAAGMRDLADVDQRGELAFLGVHHGDLVRLVGCDQEVALGRVPAAVVQEARGADLGDLELHHVGVVDQQDLAGFLDVDDELGLEMRRHDRGDARLGMVFLRVHRHAARGHDLQRLSVSPSMITNCGGQYEPAIAYLSS